MSDASLKLVWSDEFDGAWPDTADWRQGEREKASGNHAAPGFAQGNTEKQFYQVDQVSETTAFSS
jgi:hypothetical protein